MAVSAMWRLLCAAVALLPLLLSYYACGRCHTVVGAADVSDALKKIFNVQSIRNHTDVEIPEYLYRMYHDTENRQYDVIRSISPKREFHQAYSSFVYDLSAVESTENIQKAVLQFNHDPKYKVPKEIMVDVYYTTIEEKSYSHLGEAKMFSELNLYELLNPGFLKSIDKLIVQARVPKKSDLLLVLYSTSNATFANGHELAAYLFEISNKRNKRSVLDNEIDFKQNTFKDESKRKKKKKKVSRVSKLQAVDAGDTISITSVDQCRMERLVLNFADIGWEDWVIYPKGFETNYCVGGCLFPLGKGSNPTNHATVQSLARSFGRLWDLPEPSCVPDTLAPLTLLYMDHDNHALLKSYPDMRVLTCSCK